MSGEFAIDTPRVPCLANKPANFVAGKVRFALSAWKRITSDAILLSWISGARIDFTVPILQLSVPKPITFSPAECSLIQIELDNLLRKGVIERASHSEGEFISNIFFRPKKDGNIRIILNLKMLNEAVEYHHFKMDTLHSGVEQMTQGCWMASVDLKDAYYSIPVHTCDRKYLRFWWKGVLLQFTAWPNGLSEAPRKFTKIMKVPFGDLRKRGHANSAYIDDSLLLALTQEGCQDNIEATVHLVDSLGFTVHPLKSVLRPMQIVVFLGFVLNSLLMIVSLTQDKAQKIKLMCQLLLTKNVCTIREFAEVIGSLVAASPGVEYASVFIKRLEHDKVENLRTSKGDFDAIITLNPDSRADLAWWRDNVAGAHKAISHGPPVFSLSSDSSDFAWGGVCGDHRTGGPWDQQERVWHINYKELLAAFFSLKSLCSQEHDSHIRIELDNTTSVAYINNQGGRKVPLNGVARQIWLWARSKNIWLTATHLPGVLNTKADSESRKAYATESEWKLDPSIFRSFSQIYGPFDLDLFATRLNAQCVKYISWHPDPHAVAIDAFTVPWSEYNNYAFPPFSVIGRVLKKAAEEELDLALVAPLWPTQPWFTTILWMTVDTPLLLPSSPHTLRLPQDVGRTHSLYKKLHLTLFPLSGKSWRAAEYRARLPHSSSIHGAIQQKSSIGAISGSGCCFVIANKLMHFRHL